jgi:hypothetical protein
MNMAGLSPHTLPGEVTPAGYFPLGMNILPRVLKLAGPQDASGDDA